MRRHNAAVHEGFNLHAGVTVAAGQRTDLERLFLYGARPALALDRLERLPDGRFSNRMKDPVRGHTHRILTPIELLARLASIIGATEVPTAALHGGVLTSCPRCSGRMRVIAAVTDRVQVARVLAHMGERTSRAVPSRPWDPVPEGDAGVWE